MQTTALNLSTASHRAAYERAMGCTGAARAENGDYLDPLIQARWEGFAAAQAGISPVARPIHAWQYLAPTQRWTDTHERVAHAFIRKGEGDKVRALVAIAFDGSQQAGLCPDPGPWQVDDWRDGRIVIQSHATDDAALAVTGNFTSETRRAYAQALCDWLNLAPRVL